MHVGEVAPEEVAAVAILKGEDPLVGLVRIVQVAPSKCVIEVTLDRLPVGKYSINIHQLGDISSGGLRLLIKN